jgi:hypothetical protein
VAPDLLFWPTRPRWELIDHRMVVRLQPQIWVIVCYLWSTWLSLCTAQTCMTGSYASGGVCVIAPVGTVAISLFLVTYSYGVNCAGYYVPAAGATSAQACSSSLYTGSVTCQTTEGKQLFSSRHSISNNGLINFTLVLLIQRTYTLLLGGGPPPATTMAWARMHISGIYAP